MGRQKTRESSVKNDLAPEKNGGKGRQTTFLSDLGSGDFSGIFAVKLRGGGRRVNNYKHSNLNPPPTCAIRCESPSFIHPPHHFFGMILGVCYKQGS